MTKTITSNIVRSLPQDMFSEILKHTASNSVTDFINTMLTCKAFHGASNYDQIFEVISMKKHNLVPWCEIEKDFQERCKVAKNAEALYRKGMLEYFSRRKGEFGLCCLKKAAEKGHLEATYVYGIILICLGGELREQGLRLLSTLDLVNSKKRSSRIIVGCRLKTKKFLSKMWVNVALSRPKRIDCDCDPNIRERPTPSCLSPWEGQAWETSNNVGQYCCDSYFWDREAALFRSLLRK